MSVFIGAVNVSAFGQLHALRHYCISILFSHCFYHHLMRTSLARLALTIALASALSTSAFAQALIPPTRLGFSLGAGLNMGSSSQTVWRPEVRDRITGPDSSLLSTFAAQTSQLFTEGASEIGLTAGVYVGFPLTKTIHLSGRIGYNGLNAHADATQSRNDTTVVSSIHSSVPTIEITPALEFYDLIPGLDIHPIIGLELGLPIAESQSQKATATVGQSVNETQFTRDATIPNTTLRAAILLGVGYTFQLSNSMFLQPELSYRLPLTNVSTAAEYSPWTIPQLRFGVNVFFDISSKNETRPQRTGSTGITASMDRIVALDNSGREAPVPQINVEDVTYTEMFPLVPYVFHGENQTSPDATLQRLQTDRTSGEFNIDRMPLDAIEINRNLLNVIGSRMRTFNQASLTITGTHDGKGEARTANLSKQRAENAKQYLVSNFGIDAGRIATEARGLPARPSSATDPEGVAENRRVEFSSNVPDVLAPIVVTADNQRVAQPSAVVFYPTVVTQDSIASWVLSVTQAGRPLRTINGDGVPKSLTWSIRPNELSDAQVPVDWEFTANGLAGESSTVNGSIPVDYLSSVRRRTQNLPDKTVDKYSLILFDFDKAEMTADNRRILEQMVLPAIKSNSKVSIIGYTDRIGSDDHNLKLSRERAAVVKAFLSQQAKDAQYTATGVGEQMPIFAQEQAIGRHLSRTVQVVIETPRR
jgi:outer membrane protein OmpA-like peptidoglycan-associated protein